MRSHPLHKFSCRALILLSLAALLLVLYGYTLPPQVDEGGPAHIFQILILCIVPLTLLFFATADWKRPVHSLRGLSIPALTLLITFSALYYLEHVYYR
jgi:hypothetical protein